MLSGTNFKGQLVSKDETKIILENNRSVQTILKEEIHEVKVVKFSILKSQISCCSCCCPVPYLP